MTRSGATLDWRRAGLDGPVLDKHPLEASATRQPDPGSHIAACGGFVPMISAEARHTGGTLDKLDSIPGYETAPDLERFQTAVRSAGCAIVGATQCSLPPTALVRDPRRHGDRRLDPADHRIDPLQEARGRPRTRWSWT